MRTIKTVKKIKVLADVKRDISNVLIAIEGWIEKNNPLTPFSKGELKGVRQAYLKQCITGQGF